jgi:hypothetical protein
MTDTSNMAITAEDRERLAKSKFGEWFDEFFEKKFEEAFEKKASTSRAPRAQQQPGQPQPSQPEPEQPQRRRRSLLETCLSDTFGF